MGHFDIRCTPIFAESWNVAWRKRPSGSILSDTQTTFNIIENSYRYWAADPFVIEKDGSTYIFAELYDYILCRGILGCCKLEENSTTKWVPIIKEKHHLSYPCIIEWDGKIFLMPESGEGKELVLYEAIEFPYRWKRSKVLRSEISYADTTPLEWNKYKLALTHQVEDPYYPQLLLIDLEGELQDVKIDVEFPFRSRPAGNIFKNNGKYIRPVQNSLNCGEGYGKSLIFCSCCLDEKLHYSEVELKEILPSELKYSRLIFLDGMHTYNSSEHYEVIDIKTRRFNLLNFIFRIINKFAQSVKE